MTGPFTSKELGTVQGYTPLASFPRKRESIDFTGLLRIQLDSRFRGNDAGG